MSTLIEPGATISHYRITARLGAGGMGQVFRASDSRLSRDVAIKILPLTTDAMLHQRFTQEARAASALNHPNIVGVYDVGTQDGTPYIVSELVDGESLRALLGRGPVPQKKLLDLATQIADGIAAAHAAGIVHRDLKPENLMITRDGRAKILDFGLAKRQADGAALEPTDATLAMTQTQPGLIMGTANYMSPEQARGIASDYRSDQFSFGVVLYELVTGKQPFLRGTTVQTLSAVLTDDPPPIPADAKIPAPLRWIIDRCIAKEPAQRYGSSIDLYQDLRNLRDHASEMTGAAVTPAAKKSRNLPRALALVLPIVALAVGYTASRLTIPDSTDISHHTFTPIATEAVDEVNPKWSPDGKNVVYAAIVNGVSQLFVRNLDSAMPVQLTRGSKSWCRMPFWHPKEPRVFYIANGDLYSIAIAGGEPEMVVPRVSAASISPDGAALIVMTRDPGKLQSGVVGISSPPGAPTKPYLPAPFGGGMYFGGTLLRFSPDGSQIFFSVRHPKGPPEYWLLPWPNTGARETPKRIFPSIAGLINSFAWWPDSRRAIISLSNGYYDGHLWLADTRSGLVHAITTGLGGEAHADLSRDASRIAYTEVNEDFDVMDVPINEDPLRKVVATSRREGSAVWSPSGGQFAYLTDRSGAYEIWLKSTQEGWERPVVRKGDFGDGIAAVMTGLAFSPDGGRIAYTRGLVDKNSVWISPLSGGPAVRLTEDDGTGQFAPTWSPDGNWIAFLQISGASIRLVKSRVGGREAPVVIGSQLGELDVSNPRWSPKSDWITVNTMKGSALVAPDGKTSRELNKQQYQRTAWSPDGSILYGMRVVNLETLLCAIDPQTGTEKLLRKIGSDVKFQEPIDIGQTFSLDPDGKGFMTTVKRSSSDIWMLEGFHHH
jgi:serine/threonine protein kinase/Tol biopolymer transport system component